MINTAFRKYNYFTFGAKDDYGQPQLSSEVQGEINMAIFTTSTSVQDNINYKDANYIGLTYALLDETFVIQYGEEKLKVLYVLPVGRYKQAFLKRV